MKPAPKRRIPSSASRRPYSVPEREFVHAYGGTVRIAGDPKDHSTRDVIRRIVDSRESKTP